MKEYLAVAPLALALAAAHLRAQSTEYPEE